MKRSHKTEKNSHGHGGLLEREGILFRGMGEIKSHGGAAAVWLGVLLLGLWHGTDVKDAVFHCGDGWLMDWYRLLWAAAAAGLAGAGWLLVSSSGGRRLPLWRVYPAVGLLLGLAYLFVLPPLSAPDEISHYVSAYQLSSHLLGRPANDRYGRVLFDAQDVWVEDVFGSYRYQQTEEGSWKADGEASDDNVVLGQPLTEDTYRTIHDLRSKKLIPGQAELLEGKPADSLYPPVTTTPLAYLPQALFMAAARLLSLGALPMLYLGRLGNLLFFVTMTCLAMRRLPFGQEVLFGTALLPMALHLSASYSYDVMLMGCFFLFSAVCLDLACRQEQVRKRDVMCLAALMAAAGPCKMVYAVLMGLCLLIPMKKFGGFWRWLASAAVVAAAWAAAMYLVNRQVIASYAAVSQDGAYVPWAGEQGYSLELLLHQPWRLLRIYYQTLVWQARDLHLTMIGASLGNLDPVLDVPYLAVVCFSLCLLALAFRKPGERLWLTGGQRIWVGMVCAVCAAAVMGTMLIAWTPLSSKVIEGVQGRYFLPFLPVALMALKNPTVVLTKDQNRSILYLMCCVNGYVLLRLFAIVSMRL